MDLDAEMQVKRTALRVQPGEEAAAWGVGGAAQGWGGGVACAASQHPATSPHSRNSFQAEALAFLCLPMPWGSMGC